MNEQEQFDAYIKQVINIKNKREKDILKLDYADILKNMGFSREDMIAIDIEFKKALELGTGYLIHQQIDEAITALLRAYSLRSDDEKTLTLLATAYQIKFLFTYKKIHKQKAEEFACDCLNINPKNNEAFRVIQELHKPKVKTVWWMKIIMVFWGCGIVFGLSQLIRVLFFR